MPVYDYKCDRCGTVKKDVFVRQRDVPVVCEPCNFGMRRLGCCPAIQCWPADGVFLRNVSPRGERFYSKRQMQRYAVEHDLELGALL
jgi:hypothetical protein